MRNRFIVFGLIVCAIFMGACKPKDEAKHDMVFYEYFDTVIEITYFKDDVDEAKVKTVIEDKIKHLNDVLSNFEGGAIDELNKSGEKDWAEIAPILDKTLELEDKTGNKVDISKGKLFDIWRDAIESGVLPEEAAVKDALMKGGKGSVVVHGDHITLNNGAAVDLGSVCKGYLNEELKKDFDALGIKNYIISSGGNVTVHGRRAADRKNFSIGIENPFDLGDPFDIIYITDKSLVTSGDYQRFVEIDGRNYHHIVDLNTGYPSDNEKRSITIVGDDAFLCDFLSTTLFLKDKDEIDECLKDFPDYEYYIIYKDGTHFVSEGLKKYVKSFGANLE